MAKREISILVLEDNPADRELIEHELEQAEFKTNISKATDRRSFEKALAGELPDIVLADYGVPSFSGNESLRLFREKSSDVPYIVVSGSIGEQTAVDLLKAGATDFVMKNKLDRLVQAIERALEESDNRRERLRAFAELEEQIHLVSEIQDALPAPMFFKDSEGVYLGCNEAFSQLIGVRREEIIGRHGSEVLPEHVAGLAADTDREVLEHRRPRRYEYTGTDENGRIRDYIYHKAPFHHADGTLRGVVGVVLDVTVEKEYARELRKTNDLQDAVFESIDQVILVIDAHDRRITMANPAVKSVFGYEPGELEGKSTVMLHVDEGHFHEFAATGNPYLDQFGVYRTEFPFKRRDGSLFTAEITVSELSKKYGWRAGVVSVIKDISERKRADEQLQQAQRMESIGRLAGGVAHDFNNILTAVNGYLYMANQEIAEDHPARGLLDGVRSGTDRAARLTQQLLLFSRKVPSESAHFELNTTVNAMLKMLGRLIPENVKIKTKLSRRKLPIYGNDGKIEQVLMNLVINARDAMPDGGTIVIETAVDEVGEYAQLSVHDNGVGMSEETVRQIFEPFFTTKSKEAGTGLGLSVVYGIVQDHSGWIDVTSKPHHGATFTVNIPISPEEPESVEAHSSREHAPLHREPRILVVEDEEAIAETTGSGLSDAGFSVAVVQSVREARKAVENAERPFDLIMADVVLPDGSGTEIAQWFSEEDSTRLLFVSGYIEDSQEYEAIRKMGHRFLQKPYGISTLLSMLHEELSQRHS